MTEDKKEGDHKSGYVEDDLRNGNIASLIQSHTVDK